MIRQLSRLSITGHIHEYTPVCVLLEIADAHGISYNEGDRHHSNFRTKLVKSINNTPIPSINDVSTNIEWGNLARFINRNCNWSQNELVEAYNYLIKFISNSNLLDIIPEDFEVGLQTPKNIYSINSCVLYRICIDHQLNVNQWTTAHQMGHAVRMLRESVDTLYKSAVTFVQDHAKKTDLINILLLSPHQPDYSSKTISSDYNSYYITPKVSSSHQMLSLIHRSLNNITEMQKKINPTTSSGSIALAAVIFGIDISKAQDPINEYKILKVTGRNGYNPGDNWIKYWYNRNSTMFDLLVSFNPIFPECYYTKELLDQMVKSECYSREEIISNSSYELMQLAHVTETFYMGEYPNLSSKQTVINLDDFEEVPYGELFCYGALDETMGAISIDELISMFTTNRNFTNPFKSESVFSHRSISKLKKLLQSPLGPDQYKSISVETITARRNLLQLITSLEFLTKSNDKPTVLLIQTYNNGNQEIKQNIIKVLNELLNIGMYMRGWIGPGYDYPVIKAPVPRDREPELLVNITNSITKYENMCKDLGELGVQLLELPLVKYKDGEYHLSNNINDGLTIKDRIDIVKEGDTSNNIASCVRMSSNWICSSAHKYIIAIGQPSPFDIFRLRNIS